MHLTIKMISLKNQNIIKTSDLSYQMSEGTRGCPFIVKKIVLHKKTTESDLSGSLNCHLGNIDRHRREENQTALHARSSGGYSEEKYFHNCLKFYILSGLRGPYTHIFPSIEKKNIWIALAVSYKEYCALWICHFTVKEVYIKYEQIEGVFYCCVFFPFRIFPS